MTLGYVLYGVMVASHSLSFWMSVHKLGTVPTAVAKGAQQAVSRTLVAGFWVAFSSPISPASGLHSSQRYCIVADRGCSCSRTSSTAPSTSSSASTSTPTQIVRNTSRLWTNRDGSWRRRQTRRSAPLLAATVSSTRSGRHPCAASRIRPGARCKSRWRLCCAAPAARSTRSTRARFAPRPQPPRRPDSEGRAALCCDRMHGCDHQRFIQQPGSDR